MSARLTIVVLACLMSASALALADNAKRVDVPAGSLIEGLESLARQCGVDVIYPSAELKGLTTHGVSGTLEPKEAFRKLIEGTPLILKEQGSAVLISLPSASTRALSSNASDTSGSDGPSQKGKKSSSGDFRVAQVDQGQTSSPSTVEKQDDRASRKKPVQLEEVIVIGSRIPQIAGQQGAQPVREYSRADIDRSGTTTLADFLNTLPDVSVSSIGSVFGQSLGQTTVQLHGLPVGTTLVLLNGRRVPTSSNGYFDLGTLPLSAVERVDVLPIGASALYGSDAVGGAVNIVLRTNVTGLEFNGKITHASGTGDESANFGWGTTFEGGSLSLVGQVQHVSELLGTDRAFASSLEGFPPDASSVLLTHDACFPGTVYSLNGQNLPGLSSPMAAIPAGLQGKPTISDFVATAGKVNYCNLLEYTSLVPQAMRFGGLLSAHYQLNDSVDLFTEVLGSREHQRIRNGNVINTYAAFGDTLGAANPYNPFGQDVGISYTYPGFGSPYRVTETLLRPLVGVRGPISHTWSYEVSAFTSQDRTDGPSLVTVNQFTFANTITGALQSSNPATALNPFSGGAPGSPQLLQSLALPYDNQYNDRLTGAQAILQGSALALPAGNLQAVLGTEYGRESEYTASTGLATHDLHRSSWGTFAETRIPLIADRAQPERGARLSATLAARYDRSSDFGGKATWQVGALWRPVQSISVRGGYGTTYKAPMLNEIDTTPSTFPAFGIVDPFRGGEPVNAALTFGANPNLRAETGQSAALGMLYSSIALPGFELSLTGFSVDISNYIHVPLSQTIVDHPNLFPGGVVRAPPTPQDVSQGFPGKIVQVNDLFYNFGDVRVAGLNADLRYALQTRAGTITPSVSLADIVRWTSALTPAAPAVSYLSQATITGVGFAPRWKGTVGLAWSHNAASAALTGRYLGSYKDYQEFVANSHELGNLWLFDFNARCDLGKALFGASPWLRGTDVAVGAINLFDRRPQFSYFVYGFDVSQADLRGRTVYVNVGAKW